MASWAQFAAEDGELASKVKARFDIRKHKTLATIRKDGAPRISGIEVEFADGELYLGMMPDSRKLRDLERDPRLAIHSPTDDPPQGQPSGWAGEAKLSGRAVEVSPASGPGSRFRVEISEVALTHLNEAGDLLMIDTWRPGQGRRRTERR